ncbi:catalase [Pyrenophora seminiperda CCB06]|uniref:Catalase n=1 Tax=Pyrenophora seminiperda CCB06 TaxID=1302712 RepID=A0A3M7MBB9_9PLEO|nr:catalase [Pyrenophora seminiperda CCB06]
MNEDWQEAAFSTRHMHNRNTGRRGSKSSKHTSAFDVRKTFATYSIKCPAWIKALEDPGQSGGQDASLELYRLTENGEGVVGELCLPGVLNASVILAGSRPSLRGIIAGIESTTTDDNEGEEAMEEEDDPDSEEPPDSPAKTRFDTFEKNSFRSPKFWFRWCGPSPVVSNPNPSSKETTGGWESELGYIVFSGNDCRKFKGTINCVGLGWKNVALSGQKVVSRSDSDARVTWGEDGVKI